MSVLNSNTLIFFKLRGLCKGVGWVWCGKRTTIHEGSVSHMPQRRKVPHLIRRLLKSLGDSRGIHNALAGYSDWTIYISGESMWRQIKAQTSKQTKSALAPYATSVRASRLPSSVWVWGWLLASVSRNRVRRQRHPPADCLAPARSG